MYRRGELTRPDEQVKESGSGPQHTFGPIDELAQIILLLDQIEKETID